MRSALLFSARLWAAGLLSLGLLSAPLAAKAESLSTEQKSEIEGLIKTYLTKTNPQIVFEAAAEAQRIEQESQQRLGEAAVGKNKDALYNNEDSPVLGNPKGDVTIVEFFDYQCGYCKQAYETMKQLTTEDKNVRLVHKQYPVLGPMSQYLAKASTAAQLQGKYEAFHDAVMTSKARLDEKGVEEVAKTIGLDVDRWKRDMESSEVNKRVEASLALGQEVGIRGTPGFVLNDRVLPGARPLEEFKRLVEEARKAGK